MSLNLAAAKESTRGFVNMGGTATILDIALIGAESNPRYKNVILWGSPGFGKSDFSFKYIEAATGVAPFVMSFHAESSQAEMAGGYNIPDLMAGTLRYNVEDSWMAHEYVILEELFDAPDSLLMAQKDVITRGVFTSGGKQYPVKTKMIVANTNHDPSRFNGEPAKMAFLERFPLVMRVDWMNLAISERLAAYERIVKSVKGNPRINTFVYNTLAKIATSEMWSPRRVIQTTQTLRDYATAMGSDEVDTDVFIAVAKLLGFDTADKIETLMAEERRDMIAQFENGISMIFSNYRNGLQALGKSKITSVEDVKRLHAKLGEYYAELNKVSERCAEIRNEFGQESHSVVDRLTLQIEDIKAEMMNLWNAVLFA